MKTGLVVFATRPISLVALLVLAVVVSVVTFGLLLFPSIAAYYFAVSQSRRESQFIDLAAVGHTIACFWVGIKRYAGGSYVLGLAGIIPAIFLLLVPVLPLQLAWENAATWAMWLQILLVPAFFLIGSVLIFAFPELIATGFGGHSLTTGLTKGMAHPWLPLAIGLIVLMPPVSFVFHALMILTYPVLVGSAVGHSSSE